MKIKLDENLPRRVVGDLEKAGHDVTTVVEEGLAGGRDVDVIAAAANEGRMLITLDRGLGDLRAHPPGSHSGIIVVRSQDQSAPNVANLVRRLEDEVSFQAVAGCIIILEEERIRIRRPAPSPSDP